MATSLRLLPIDPEEANRLRAGATVYDVADSFPGYPYRQCLQDAAVGEVLALVSYDPFILDSPYRSASPIFLHKEDCGPADTGAVQGQQLRRQLSVRAFDQDEMMLAGEVINGIELEETAARLGLLSLRVSLLVYWYPARIISTSDISLSWAQQEFGSAHGVPSIELSANLHCRTTS